MNFLSIFEMNFIGKYFIISFILSLHLSSFGQDTSKMLLLDPNVQLECTDAVNDMYNFKFERAEKQFQILKIKYPDHPLAYFLMGLSTWWKMIPNIAIETHDDTFLAYMDTSIAKSEKLYENDDTKIEAAFFLSAAHGFKAELYGERGSYAKATFAGRNALKYLSEYKDNNDLSPEFLYGLGLYNYYEVWIKEEYPLLKPILFFFPNGDKVKGLEQLKEVAQNAFYTRTEAQYQLVKILASPDENKYDEALPYTRYLHESFPDNAFFHRQFAKTLYNTYNYRELEPVCQQILARIDSNQTGYEEVSGRYAAFFLGQINNNRNPALAKEYYKKAVYFAEKIGITNTGYYLYSLKHLAEMAEKEGNKEQAKIYYKKIKENAPGDDDEYKEMKRNAKKNLRKK